MFTTTVEPGMAAPKSQVHQDLEELIIIKAGTLEQSVNGQARTLKPGSVTLIYLSGVECSPRDSEHRKRTF